MKNHALVDSSGHDYCITGWYVITSWIFNHKSTTKLVDNGKHTLSSIDGFSATVTTFESQFVEMDHLKARSVFHTDTKYGNHFTTQILVHFLHVFLKTLVTKNIACKFS